MDTKNKTYLALLVMILSLVGSYVSYYINPFLATIFILIFIGALYVLWEELHETIIQE